MEQYTFTKDELIKLLVGFSIQEYSPVNQPASTYIESNATPSPAKPPVNGELLGFLEIEIEKANKNGKDCNLKDGDLNRAQAWYSAAESFSIVKNKITELLNTPHGHESSIINCPSCNAVWNLSRHNSCQCGATLVTKASPAKAEQEGPKPISSYLKEYGQLNEYKKLLGGGMRPEYTLEQVKAMGWQEVLHMLTGYVDILNLMDGTIHALEDGAAQWEAEAKERQQEQEGLRWVKLEDYKFTPWETVCAKWEPQPGNYWRSCCYKSTDGIITWVGEKPHEKLQVYILDESTTPPVKEAPQPYLQVIQNFTISDIDSPTFTHTEDFRKHFDYIKKKLMEAIKESHPHTAGDFMSFVGKELKDKQQSSLSKEEELIYRIVEQWGNAMCSMDEMVQWLKDYAAQSRHQPAGESAVWVKASKRLPVEDGYVCLKVNGGYMGAFVRTMTPPGSNGVRWITDSGGHTIRNWKQAEWLDESGLASSREREVAIAFAEWISQEPHLFGSANYGWYYDIPFDGAGVEHKLIGDTNDLYDFYLQSSSNT